METKNLSAVGLSETTTPSTGEDVNSQSHRLVERRSFLKTAGIAGATLAASGLLAVNLKAQRAVEPEDERSGSLTAGDAAILRFLAAAEIIESDLWLQYAELGGVQDNELPTLASQLIPGYPAQPTGGNPIYTRALQQLDGDMPQYIADNTDDEMSHELFINAYLKSKGAKPVDLKGFQNLLGSQVTDIPGIASKTRLTNLMELSVDTSWWTRYRSTTQNPDFGDTFPNAVPTLAGGKFTAIPRNNAELEIGSTVKPVDNHVQAIANTAGFHFAFIEQGGTSLYATMAQKVTSLEVLRIVLSIGGTETMHFQTWHDKAGNALQISFTDPVNGFTVSFPNLNDPKNTAAEADELQTNLIMPEPTFFLDKKFGRCSIVRPTETNGAAMGALASLKNDGLFIGHTSKSGKSDGFIELLTDLAEDADEAQRGGI